VIISLQSGLKNYYLQNEAKGGCIVPSGSDDGADDKITK
jgi:hypothetical protein